MRAAGVLLASLVMAGPAAGQVPLALQLDNERWAEQQLARQREIAIYNELSAMDARIRTDQALRDLERQRRPEPTPALREPRRLDTGGLATIPDDRLAASNARVRAAASNRR